MRRKSAKPRIRFDVVAHAAKVQREFERLRGKVDVDDGDLVLILDAVLRPFGSGRNYFIRAIRPGVYVA